MINTTVKTLSAMSKHRIPRYVYHLTNKSNYERIIQSGELKCSISDVFVPEAVFLADLVNFFKRWKFKPAGSKISSLQEKLLYQVQKDEGDLVMLRIPTAKLDSEKLFLRNPNRCFDLCDKYQEKFDEYADEILAKYGGEFKPENEKAMFSDLREILKEFLSGEKDIDHIFEGVPAKFSKLFKQRKEPIEYLPLLFFQYFL